MTRLLALSVLCALAVTACGGIDANDATNDPDSGTSAGGDGGTSASGDAAPPPVSCDGETYCPEEMWLCRPDLAENRCAEEQTATVFEADGTQNEVTLPKAAAPAFDCFYVYPTVALSGEVGNVSDFSNLEDILVPLRAQAVPFTELCEVYAPLYHQIRLPTYGSADVGTYLDTAYEDVAAAFDFYMEHYNRGRELVLLGHSQGAHMLRRLLQRKFEGNPALLDRLIVAMPIGSVGDITVPIDETTGGTFDTLSLCTSMNERGCVVSFDSTTAIAAGAPAPAPAGATTDPACTNPANLNGDVALLRGSYVPTLDFAGQFGAGNAPDYPTTFVAYHDLFTGQCARGASGALGYQIAFAPGTGDQRVNPVDFATQVMHILDYSFPLEDLIELVRTKAAAP